MAVTRVQTEESAHELSSGTPGGLPHLLASHVTELFRPARFSIHEENWIADRPRSMRRAGVARNCRTTEAPSMIDCPNVQSHRPKMKAAADARKRAFIRKMFIKSVERQLQGFLLDLTTKAAEGVNILRRDTGADDYIVKPFSKKEVFAQPSAVSRRVKKGALPQYATYAAHR